jgi:indole-3-acetaldehyde oxidase
MSIFIPNWDSDGVTFETFRAAPRPFGNAVSYVNSAFLARTASGENLMEDICLPFGAYGIDHAIRASKVEAFLKDKPVSSFVILKAVQLLKETVSPSEGTTHPEYRISLAVSFLFTFLSSLTKSMNEPAKVNVINGSYTNGTRDTSSGYSLKEHLKVDRNYVPIHSRQEMVFDDEYRPVGKPIKKVGAELQAFGIFFSSMYNVAGFFKIIYF